MRLLLFITDLELGGTPIVVRELATRLRDADTQVEVACLKPAGIVGEQLKARGIDVSSFNATSVFEIGPATRALRQLIRKRQIDTVLSFLMHANVVAARASRRLPESVRFFQSVQTTQPTPRWHWWLQQRVMNRAKAIIVPSKSVAALLTKPCDSRGPIVVIPNAVDTDHFRSTSVALMPERSDATRHERDALAPKRTRVGFVGRLDPIKRVDVLIDAFRQLNAKHFSLEIFGDGAERRTLEARARRTEGITFHGMIADARVVYAQIDTLVLPSDAEGFGLVLIEAMAAGVPVIGTNVSGIRDVIRDGETGILVAPRDPAALAAAIVRLRDDVSLRERLIANALADVAARFNWDAVLNQYRSVLGAK